MRSIALFPELLVLLPIVLLRPFVGVILWSWISFMNPHRLVFGGIALEMPWASIIFFATIFGCVLAREPKRFPVNAVTVQIGLFLVLICITSLFALAPWENVEAKWELTFKAFLFLLVTAALLTSKERIHALIWIMALSLAYFGIKGGGFTLAGGGSELVYGPESSMIRDNNHLATAMLVGMPLMNYLRLESRHAIIRYGFLAAMALTLLAVVGSYSRGAILALAAVAGFFWLKSSNKLISGMFVALALVASFWFEVLAEHGFPTFFVWLGISIAGAIYAHRVIKRATGVPGLEWCVNLAKMAQVSMVAYVALGSFLSLSYWDYYFTILIAVTAVYQHVTATLGQSAPEHRRAFGAVPARLALSR